MTVRETQDLIPVSERLEESPVHDQVPSNLQRSLGHGHTQEKNRLKRNQGRGHIQGVKHPKRDQGQGQTQKGITAKGLYPSQDHVHIHTTVAQGLGLQDEGKDHSLDQEDIKDHPPGHAINLPYLKV